MSETSSATTAAKEQPTESNIPPKTQAPNSADSSSITASSQVKRHHVVEHIHFDKKWASKRGSGGLAPSKSTVYLANLPFSLTNNDLHKILERFGRCIKVSIPRDKDHRSKGIAFALFLEREPCIRVINAFNGKQLFGRTLVCGIARDNGRAREFIRRREYPDKSRCYECGEFGHLSYKCSKNVLGERRRPRKKKKRKKERDEVEDEYFNPDISLAEAIAEDANIAVAMETQFSVPDIPQSSLHSQTLPTQTVVQDRSVLSDNNTETVHRPVKRKVVSGKRYHKDSYFSDEEVLDEGDGR